VHLQEIPQLVDLSPEAIQLISSSSTIAEAVPKSSQKETMGFSDN